MKGVHAFIIAWQTRQVKEDAEILRNCTRVLKKDKKCGTIEKIACGGQYAEDRTSFCNEFGKRHAWRA